MRVKTKTKIDSLVLKLVWDRSYGVVAATVMHKVNHASRKSFDIHLNNNNDSERESESPYEWIWIKCVIFNSFRKKIYWLL